MKHYSSFLFALLAAALSLSLMPTPKGSAQTPAPKSAPVKQDGAPAKKESATEKKDGAVKTLPGAAKRYALIIGVDKYADSQISTLNGASNDSRSLAQALAAYGGFPANQVILLNSNQPGERQPTRGNILRRLSNLATVVPKDGLLLFAFAGHGIERGGQAYLLPSDAQVNGDVKLLEETAINVNQVRDWIKQTEVKQVLMILDACRNEPDMRGARGDADNPLTPAYTRAFDFDRRNHEVEAFATLYATAIGHRAYEYREKKQGYFTYALVEAMKGAANNFKGEVTLGSLIEYMQNSVPQRVALDLGKGKVQKPFAVVEGYKADELVIAAGGDERGIEMTKATDFADMVEVKPEAEKESGGRGDVFINLEGTMWTAKPLTGGTVVIEFQKDGKLLYTLTPERGNAYQPVKGQWRQEGGAVQYSVGSYSVMDGKIEGGVIRAEGENAEGVKFRLTLFPLRP